MTRACAIASGRALAAHPESARAEVAPSPARAWRRVMAVLVWVTQGAGVAELSDHAGTRVGFDWTIREFLERQWMFARRLLPTWYLVLALPALVAGLADARSRFLTAILASMVVAFAVVPADNAWVHDYWNFPALMALFPGFVWPGRCTAAAEPPTGWRR